MTEHGTDRYGAEYKRTDNDFHARYLEQDNCICSICHGTGAKIEIRYVVRNYESARAKKKICKNLQAHERSIWICPKCINNFKQKLSVLETLPSAHSEIIRCKDCKYAEVAEPEIVRCKDCMWYDQEHPSTVFYNSFFCKLWQIFSKPDHFCANGTRSRFY